MVMILLPVSSERALILLLHCLKYPGIYQYITHSHSTPLLTSPFADTTIYNMCTQKPPHDHSEQLYLRYREAFQTYIADSVLPSLHGHHGEHLLRQLVHRWNNHKIMVRWLSRFFNYLDRYYIQRHTLHSLNDVGLMVFRDSIYAKMKKKAREAVLKQVEAEREGEQVDLGLLRDVLAIFQEVGMGSLECYEIDYEKYLLSETAAYFRCKAAVWIEEDSTPEYLIKAEQCLRAEEGRVDRYLHIDTKPKLLNESQNELLAAHQMRLLEKEHSGCAALLRDDKKDDLARMYRLFGRIPKGLEPMAEMFREHVESEGLKLVNEAAEAVEAKKEQKDREAGGRNAKSEGVSPEHAFIRRIISLHDTYMAYVTDCFGASSLFHKALKEAFETFCNKQVGGSSAAELMASFCDTLLRKGGGERLSDEDLDAVLDKLVRLLAYVSDKDLFAEFYRKRLARRLLMTTSASEDAEKAVLSRLKQQCGQQFTSKMEGMVQDLQLAKEKERSFNEWLNRKSIKLPIDLSVTVLTTGFWPSYKTLEINLPSEMLAGVEQFSRFHDDTSKKTRRLTWQLSLGQVTIKASFDKTYELMMSPSQTVVLLAFDETNGPISLEELQERTKLPEEDLKRSLQSLYAAKYKLLVKSPAGRSLNKGDTFTINEKFSDRARRVRVPLPPLDDRRKVTEEVDKDRKHAIEAAIVRIMKSRKALQHSNLIMEVVQQLQAQFNPDVKLIKRAIEGLIEREYVERDASNQQMYKYMA
jgi:cullin 1